MYGDSAISCAILDFDLDEGVNFLNEPRFRWKPLRVGCLQTNKRRGLASRPLPVRLFLRDVPQKEIAQRNQPLQLLPVGNRQVAKPELAHQEEAVFYRLADADRLGICGHYLGHQSRTWQSSRGNNAIHDVALGKHAD